MNLLIAGLGNSLLMDEGIGVHAVRALERDPPPGARVVEIGTAVLDALHLLEEADRVLALDAIQAGGAPGSIYQVNFSPDRKAEVKQSMHELDLREAILMLPEDQRPELLVLGVEPLRIEYNLDLSAEVQAVLPQLIETVRKLAADLLSA